jgi:hypothetical protein
MAAGRRNLRAARCVLELRCAGARRVGDKMVLASFVITIGALVLAGVQAWYARQSAPRRLELTRDVSITPLISGTDEVRDRLEVWHGSKDGSRLRDPQVVQISLHNTGKRAVTSELFDRQLPYVVSIGTPIVDLLTPVNNLDEHPALEAEFRGDELLIGPGAIYRGQRLTYAVLVDGPPKIRHRSPLPTVRLADAEQQEHRARAAANVAGVLAGVTGGAGLLALGFVLSTLSGAPPVNEYDGCPFKNRISCLRWHEDRPQTPPSSSTPTSRPPSPSAKSNLSNILVMSL